MDDTVDWALRYVGLGWRVVPIKPGTKRPPMDDWGEAASDDPEIVRNWFTGLYRTHGVGVATGARSGMWVLDVDPAHGGRETLAALIEQYGPLPETASVLTGGGGWHFYYLQPAGMRVPLSKGKLGPGIDVRGDGGQVVAPPTIHPDTGEPYRWANLCPLGDGGAWTFQVRQRLVVPLLSMPELDDEFEDSPAAWVRAQYDWQVELPRDGWTLGHRRGDDEEWTRPGKDPRAGTSATLHTASGVLAVWTTAAFIPPGHYNMFGYLAWRDFGGDRSACARWARAQMPRERSSAAPGGRVASVETPAGVVLPESFWTARTALHSVRQAAHHRTRAADAVLAGVLARVAAMVPHTITLPPTVGARATFDFVAAIVADSGMGKSTATGISGELLPSVNRDILWDAPVGSGEGLIEAYYGWVSEVGEGGKNQRVRKRVRNSVHVMVDEGQVVADLASRRGSTLLPVLRSMAMGNTTGQTNASVETNRRLEARSYRFAALIAIQTEYAGRLLDDAAGGTPQRIVWFAGSDPSIPDTAPSWPLPLGFVPPAGAEVGITVSLDHTITREVVDRARARARGQADENPLDAHRDLLRLKVAGLLAILDGRRDRITPEDWALAGMVMDTSDRVRATIVEAQHASAQRQRDARADSARSTHRALAQDDHDQSLLRGARALAKRMHRIGGLVAKRDLMSAVASRDKANASVDEMIDYAEQQGWIAREQEQYQPGPSTPA